MNRSTLVHVTIIATLLCLLLILGVNTSSGEDTELHMNMKEDMSLLPEPREDPDAAAATIRVEADYFEDPVFQTRSSKDWVPVGTWRSQERLFNISWTGDLTINLHYSIHQEGYNADPEFDIGFGINGVQGGWVRAAEDNDDENVYVLVIHGGFNSDTINSSDTLELEIQYSGYEDCSVYFDNITYDSGVALDSDFLRPQHIEAKDNMVEVQVCDAFDSHWDRVVDFWQISADGEPINASVVDVRDAGTVIINETEVPVTSVEWVTDELIDGGADVEVWMMYTPNSYSPDSGMGINVTAQSGDLMAPVAVITEISPDPADEGEDVKFDASDSYDDDGSIYTYRWVSDIDGTLYEGTKETYTTDELSLGEHTITLDVRDDDGLWSDEDSGSVEVLEVTNADPTILLTSPDNETVFDTDLITLTWEGEDEDDDDLTYDLYFGTDDPPLTVVVEGSDAVFHDVYDLEDGTTYYWQVVVSDGTNTTESEVWSFTVEIPDDNTVPEIMLLSPIDGVILPTDGVSMVWRGEDDDDDDLTYDVYLGSDQANLTLISANQTNSFYQPIGLIEGSSYYWKIVVQDGSTGTPSDVWMFGIEIDEKDDSSDDEVIPGFEIILILSAVLVGFYVSKPIRIG